MSTTDDLIPLLKKLRLSGVLQSLELRTRQAADDDLSHGEFLLRLLSAEVERRDSKQLDARLRRASFEGPRSIEDFDFHLNPKIPKSKVIDLATCGFVERKENVLLVGRAGIGKSHIAQALGQSRWHRRLRAARIRRVVITTLDERTGRMSKRTIAWTIGVAAWMVVCMYITWRVSRSPSDDHVERQTAPRTQSSFYCYKTPRLNYAERECRSVPLTACREPLGKPENCFNQDHAYCFYTEHVSGGKQYVCLVTQSECESWHRIEAEAAAERPHPVGPCLRMLPDDPSIKELE